LPAQLFAQSLPAGNMAHKLPASSMRKTGTTTPVERTTGGNGNHTDRTNSTESEY
jgi:hypothetical protein